MEIGNSRERLRILEGQKTKLESDTRSLLVKCRSDVSNNLAWMLFERDQIECNKKLVKKFEDQISYEQERQSELYFELSEISKRRRALESLKEKKLKEYKMLESRKEQKRLDDIYQILKR